MRKPRPTRSSTDTAGTAAAPRSAPGPVPRGRPGTGMRRAGGLLGVVAVGVGTALAPGVAGASPRPAAGPTPAPVGRPLGSAVAANGDANPYGIAVVPQTMGNLVAGNLLVADFNNPAGTAGGGMSIVQVDPTTRTSTTFVSGLPVSGPVGIAINPVNDGVWVGDFGATGGTSSNDLLILPTGVVKATFDTSTTASPVTSGDQPTFGGVWGQGVSQTSAGISFYYGTTGSGVTGAGGGEVWRLDPHPTATTSNGQPVNSAYVEIASGLGDNATSMALPVTAANAAGPQGFAYDSSNGTLYVSDDANNTIYALPGAATATAPVAPMVVARGGAIDTPENLAIDPASGDLIVANAGNNTVVALDPTTGNVMWSRSLDRGAPGALFGIAVVAGTSSSTLYYDDDYTNALYALPLPASPAGRVYVTPPPPHGPGTVQVRVTANDAGSVVHLFDEYAGAHTYLQKAMHVSSPISYVNGVWVFDVTNVKATNHFYAVVNGVKSNVVTAPIR